MITYKIVSNSGKKNEGGTRQLLNPTSPGFKELVFRRVLAKCNFQEGQWAKVRGTSKRVKIVKIITDLNNVHWEKDRPFFIEVETEDGIKYLSAPHQLHRKKMR